MKGWAAPAGRKGALLPGAGKGHLYISGTKGLRLDFLANQSGTDAMNRYDRALIQGLFTLATEILEDTHITATAGQSLKNRRAQYKQYADVLRAAGRDLDAMALAIAAMINKSRLRTPFLR